MSAASSSESHHFPSGSHLKGNDDLSRSFPPISYLPQSLASLFESLSIFTSSPNPISVQISSHLDVDQTRRLPASAARPCSLLHVPVSSAVTVPVHSPLCRPCTAPRSLSAPRGFNHLESLHIYVSLPCPTRFILRILVSSSFGVHVKWIFAKRLEEKAPTLPGSRAPWSYPPATWP